MVTVPPDATVGLSHASGREDAVEDAGFGSSRLGLGFKPCRGGGSTSGRSGPHVLLPPLLLLLLATARAGIAPPDSGRGTSTGCAKGTRKQGQHVGKHTVSERGDEMSKD